ncbi:ABC transporter substrate-binding protein [Paenibacillus arenilitoris]|uniref:Extracellular solute-binding protein n=1 Tax=Paenibacillus arenilitoris TaxID=2772299 RepID=A0A927CGJ5_9BACL|nr:extracellular solute-binding protein [Paenibacillus arenilitoris]MBD2867150.1 extracellular solute-binding protein [Paenibacillus arenilitoris]
MRHTKKIVQKHKSRGMRTALAAAVLMTAALSGCSGNAEEPAPSSPAAGGQAGEGSIPADKSFKIKVMSWQGPQEQYGPAYNAAFDEYMKLHPNVKIEHLYQPLANNGYDKLLDTQFVSHEAPDAMQLNKYSMRKYADQDYLALLDGPMQQLSAYNDSAARWVDTFAGGEKGFTTLKSFNKYGAITSIPVDGGPGANPVQPFYYNKDMFDKAGIAELPETWAELIEACRKLEAAGFDALAADGNRFMQWITTYVGNQLEPGHVPGLFEEKYRIPELKGDMDAIALLTGKYKADNPVEAAELAIIKDFSQYWQDGWAAVNEDQAKQAFLLGKTAMYMSGNWDYSYFEQNVKGFAFGIIPFPVITKETTPFASEMLPVAGDQQSYGWSVNKDLENDPDKLKVVIDLFQFLTGKETQKKMSDAGVFVPVVSGVSTPDKVKPFIATANNKIPTVDIFSGPLFALANDNKAILQVYLTTDEDTAGTMERLHQQAATNARKKASDALDAEGGVPNQIEILQQSLDKQKADNAPAAVVQSTTDSLNVAKLKLELYKQYAEPLLK